MTNQYPENRKCPKLWAPSVRIQTISDRLVVYERIWRATYIMSRDHFKFGRQLLAVFPVGRSLWVKVQSATVGTQCQENVHVLYKLRRVTRKGKRQVWAFMDKFKLGIWVDWCRIDLSMSDYMKLQVAEGKKLQA